jgi:hypothetical protein
MGRLGGEVVQVNEVDFRFDTSLHAKSAKLHVTGKARGRGAGRVP